MKIYATNFVRTESLCNMFDTIQKLKKKGFAQKVCIIPTDEYCLIIIKSKCSSASCKDIHNRVEEIVKTCPNAIMEIY